MQALPVIIFLAALWLGGFYLVDETREILEDDLGTGWPQLVPGLCLLVLLAAIGGHAALVARLRSWAGGLMLGSVAPAIGVLVFAVLVSGVQWFQEGGLGVSIWELVQVVAWWQVPLGLYYVAWHVVLPMTLLTCVSLRLVVPGPEAPAD